MSLEYTAHSYRVELSQGLLELKCEDNAKRSRLNACFVYVGPARVQFPFPLKLTVLLEVQPVSANRTNVPQIRQRGERQEAGSQC